MTHYLYGMPEDAETHFEPASTSYDSYAMFGFPTHDLAFHVESDFEPKTMPGGTPIPYHAERFGSTSNIAPSVPVWKLHHISLLGLELAIRLGYQTRDE